MANYRLNLYKNVIAELRRALSEERITQQAIGDALGLKQSAVSTLMSGKTRMTLDQYFALCDLVALKPQAVLQKANLRVAEIVAMTPEIEQTLYKTDLHLLAYCAAIQEVSPEQLSTPGVDPATLHNVFEELVKVGLLMKKKQKYVQKNPQITYQASSRLRGSKAHQQVVARSWNLFDRKYADKEFISTKFNSYIVDRFTKTQTKDIEAALWKVYEKVQSIREINMAKGYSDDEKKPLWNMHMMLMTPFETEK